MFLNGCDEDFETVAAVQIIHYLGKRPHMFDLGLCLGGCSYLSVQLLTKVCVQNWCLLSRALSTEQQHNLAGGAAYNA